MVRVGVRVSVGVGVRVRVRRVDGLQSSSLMKWPVMMRCTLSFDDYFNQLIACNI